MQPVIVMFLFFVHSHVVGAQLIGSAPNEKECQAIAAKYATEHEGQEPKDELGNVATPFPVCIDTSGLGDALEELRKPAAKHGPSTQL